ncbi:MAG: TetR/AcrR family transcriptional regulator [Devosia sp.]
MSNTRKQAQHETRKLLLTAASTLAVRKGIAALSTRSVCDAAGFSQGAFYSNFENMDALLLALMDQHLSDEIDQLNAVIDARSSGSIEGLNQALTAHFSGLAADGQLSLLSVELQVHALREPAFAARYDATRSRYLDALSGVIGTVLTRHGMSPALPVRELARGLHALWTGMAVQSAANAEISSERMLLAFFMALADGQPDDNRPGRADARGTATTHH